MYVPYTLSVIRKRKNEYYLNLFCNLTSNKDKWDLINKIIGKEKKVVLPNVADDDKLAHNFNIHFTNIITNQSFIDNNEFKKFIFFNPNTFVFYDVSDSEVLETINSFPVNKSCDYDGLNFKILKFLLDKNVNFFTNFINKSFHNGIFPDVLKRATVTPIFKSGDKNILHNYRPISILPSFSKLIEKIISNRIYNFLNNSHFFAENQFGFMKNRSTTDALLDFSNFIYNSINNNKKTLAIYLDISKAFDSVNHNLLIQKLQAAGIRENCSNWFISYLSNRMQRVKIGNSFSHYSKLDKGVPQGSTLGPLLFLIFINDLCKLKLNGKMITYADDSVLLYSSHDLDLLKQDVEKDLMTINNWFSINDLILNLNKSKFMFFSLTISDLSFTFKYHSTTCRQNFNCSCITLKPTNSIKYLGLHIDSNLKWKTHVSELLKKLRFVLYNYYYLRKKVSNRFLINLYYSWFYPIINYGIVVWGGDYKSNISPLISIQNKLFKILNGSRDSNIPIFKVLNLLPIRHNVIFRMILFLYRNNSLCNLKTNISARRPNEIYQIPFPHKEIFRKHFSYLAPINYNKLPTELQSIPSFQKFKKSLFKFILSLDDIESYFIL